MSLNDQPWCNFFLKLQSVVKHLDKTNIVFCLQVGLAVSRQLQGPPPSVNFVAGHARIAGHWNNTWEFTLAISLLLAHCAASGVVRSAIWDLTWGAHTRWLYSGNFEIWLTPFRAIIFWNSEYEFSGRLNGCDNSMLQQGQQKTIELLSHHSSEILLFCLQVSIGLHAAYVGRLCEISGV